MIDDHLPIKIRRPRVSGRDPDVLVWIRIEAFLKTKTRNTQVTYRGLIKEWCGFLGATLGTKEGGHKLLHVSDLHVAAYRIWLEARPGEQPRIERPVAVLTDESPTISNKFYYQYRDGTQSTLSNATIAKKLLILRKVYRVLMGAELGVRTNPFDTDINPIPPKDSGRKRPTEMVPFEIVEEILRIPDRATETGRRDHAILCALFGGALRRSEVVKLRVGDFRTTSKGTVFLYLRNTKAKKDQEQALPTWAAKAMEAVREDRLSHGAKSGDFLFVSYRGRRGESRTEFPISGKGIYRLFKRYCLLAGGSHYASPHSARATAITRLLSTGLSHREVQEFSRHASIQMVEVYDKRIISIEEHPGKNLEFRKKTST